MLTKKCSENRIFSELVDLKKTKQKQNKSIPDTGFNALLRIKHSQSFREIWQILPLNLVLVTVCAHYIKIKLESFLLLTFFPK